MSPIKRGKENSFDENADAKLSTSNSTPISGENKSKKAKREGLKEISNADKVADDSSIQSGPKGHKVSKKISEKKRKTTGKDDCVPVEKKSSKKRVSDEVSLHPIKPDDNRSKNDGGKSQDKLSEKKMKTTKKDGYVPVEKRSSKKRASDELSIHPIKPDDDRSKNDGGKGQDKMSKKKMKTTEKDGCVPLKKKSSKKRVSDEVSLPIKPDDDIKNNNDVKGQDAGVLNVSKDVNAKAKKRKSKDLEQSHEIKKCATNLEKTEVVDIPLPQGTILTTVWGIDLSPEDVGHALQFLEFCASFGKVILVCLVES